MNCAQLYERAAANDLPPHVFDHYTFRQAMIFLRGRAAHRRDAMKREVTGAWLNARLQRTKPRDFPKLEVMLRRIDPERPREMSAKEIRSVIFGFAKRVGAKIVELPKKD